MKSVEVVGSITPGLSLIKLGANSALVNISMKEGDASYRVLLLCIISRLVINPIIGGIIIYALMQFQILTDPIMIFVFIIR